MVDVTAIEQLFRKHFDYKGRYSIDATSGLISCTADVNLKSELKVTEIPVAFDHVMGHFNCENNQLESLKNAPLRVGLYFSCKNNPLKSLDGLPTKVGALSWITWHDRLPLLRMLDLTWFMLLDAPDQVLSIMNKYKGQGISGSFSCAHELELAGYKGNAAW